MTVTSQDAQNPAYRPTPFLLRVILWEARWRANGACDMPVRAQARFPQVVSPDERGFIPTGRFRIQQPVENAKPVAKKPHETITFHQFLRNGWK
jgi:hypothetical protein